MTQSKEGPKFFGNIVENSLTDSVVIDYLHNHPDFLIRHPSVLEALNLPPRWSGDGVVDMQHFLISRNRTTMNELRDCALDVIETSRSNMSTQARAHAAVLALIAARQWSDIIHVVTHDWPLLLDLDVVSLVYEPCDGLGISLVDADLGQLEAGAIDVLIGPEQDVRLFKKLSDDGTLFGSGAGLVRSAALVRMSASNILPAGVLALGARSDTFKPGQGTELLLFLCRVLEKCIGLAFQESSEQRLGFGD